jgi:hypothetical protein
MIEDTAQDLIQAQGAYRGLYFADLDNDGDLDLGITAMDPGGYPFTKIYRNDNGIFYEAQSLVSVKRSSLAFGDYNNDGWIDLVITGDTGYKGYVTLLYRNDGTGTLVYDDPQNLFGVRYSSCAWADVDNDGDLDLIVLGSVGENWIQHTKLYLNDEADTGNPNTPPSPPNQFSAVYEDSALVLSWDKGQDTQTPEDGLYYNLRVGTNPGSNDIVTGVYATPLFGNMQQRRQISLNVPDMTYYWAVQTIDTGLLASEWSEEQIYNPVGIDDTNIVIDNDFTIYPNPFSSSTIISFNLTTNLHEQTRIEIYNIKGQRVKIYRIPIRQLVDEPRILNVVWNGTDNNGHRLQSGIYFIKLVSGNYINVKKVVMISD